MFGGEAYISEECDRLVSIRSDCGRCDQTIGVGEIYSHPTGLPAMFSALRLYNTQHIYQPQ